MLRNFLASLLAGSIQNPEVASAILFQLCESGAICASSEMLWSRGPEVVELQQRKSKRAGATETAEEKNR
jgi:hypothetical protein